VRAETEASPAGDPDIDDAEADGAAAARQPAEEPT
jgi:hypothetical protein